MMNKRNQFLSLLIAAAFAAIAATASPPCTQDYFGCIVPYTSSSLAMKVAEGSDPCPDWMQKENENPASTYQTSGTRYCVPSTDDGFGVVFCFAAVENYSLQSNCDLATMDKGEFSSVAVFDTYGTLVANYTKHDPAPVCAESRPFDVVPAATAAPTQSSLTPESAQAADESSSTAHLVVAAGAASYAVAVVLLPVMLMIL